MNKKSVAVIEVVLVVVILALMAVVLMFGSTQSDTKPLIIEGTGAPLKLDGKTIHTVPVRVLPDSKLTPGMVTGADKKTVCSTKWGLDRRHVTKKMKLQVCSQYGITAADCTGKNYEIDHLVPRELAGADNVLNLWPQPWAYAHTKDHLENWLHTDVCSDKMELKDSQHAIAANWWQAYQVELKKRVFSGYIP